MQKKIFLLTYLPYFVSGRYRKQTIFFFRPMHIIFGQWSGGVSGLLYIDAHFLNPTLHQYLFYFSPSPQWFPWQSDDGSSLKI